jgi:hypothetical protein
MKKINLQERFKFNSKNLYTLLKLEIEKRKKKKKKTQSCQVTSPQETKKLQEIGILKKTRTRTRRKLIEEKLQSAAGINDSRKNKTKHLFF